MTISDLFYEAAAVSIRLDGSDPKMRALEDTFFQLAQSRSLPLVGLMQPAYSVQDAVFKVTSTVKAHVKPMLKNAGVRADCSVVIGTLSIRI